MAYFFFVAAKDGEKFMKRPLINPQIVSNLTTTRGLVRLGLKSWLSFFPQLSSFSVLIYALPLAANGLVSSLFIFGGGK